MSGAKALYCPQRAIMMSKRYWGVWVMTESGLEGAWVFGGFGSPGIVDGLVPGVTITAEFSATGVHGNGGCNTYWARYVAAPAAANAGQIQIDLAGSTDRTCSEEINALEQRYLEALAEVKDYQITDDDLILRISKSGWLAFTRSHQEASDS